MKIYNITQLLLLVPWLALTACPSSETTVIRDGGIYAGGDSPIPTSCDGGCDTGGENSAIDKDGVRRPIDSIRTKIEDEYPEFRETVIPLLRKIAIKDPILAGEMIHIWKRRVWKAVKASLAELNSSAIGVPISNVVVDQVAQQGLKEVWLDDPQIQAMKDSHDRVITFVHELVIGVRILEFADSRDLCYARVAVETLPFIGLDDDDQRIQSYDNGTSKCDSKFKADRLIPGLFKREKRIDIDKRDYPRIRDVAYRLVNEIDKLSTDTVQVMRLADLGRGEEDLSPVGPSPEVKTETNPASDSAEPQTSTEPRDP